jgi:hypothetical protein
MGNKSTFPHQKNEITSFSVQCYEVKLFNQFSSEFTALMQKYNTSNSICGYLAPVISQYLCENLTEIDLLPEIIEELNRPEVLFPLTEKSMEFIQTSRQKYIDCHPELFEENEKKNYIKDWVANYEISDYVLNLNDKSLTNLFFFRYVGWDFPLEAEKTTHEEKERLNEELPFKGNKFFMESFYERRELHTIENWKKSIKPLLLTTEDFLVFIADLKGHFVSFVYIVSRKRLILLDTTKASYLNSEVVGKLAELMS